LTVTRADKKNTKRTETSVEIANLFDLLGQRWALRVVHELAQGPLTFREIQSACGGISPTVLNARLGELRESALVEANDGDGYSLGRDGQALVEALEPVVRFAHRSSVPRKKKRTTRR
jgi:DNA-binding HxlR family transcriptional regulator